jgi:hypothetical protein
MPSSRAFFISPLRRFEKVTCRLVLLSILWIAIFPLPISSSSLQLVSLSLSSGFSLSLYLSGRGRRRADEICEKREQTWNKIGLPGGANDAVERRKAV